MVGGLSAGALIGSRIIQIGRRNTMLIMNAIGLIGVTMIMFENKWLLLTGRMVYGFAVGVESVAMPRYLDEVVPLRLYNVCIALYVTSINVGFLFALDGAVFIPKDYETQEQIDDNVGWRILFGIPYALFIPQTILLLLFVK